MRELCKKVRTDTREWPSKEKVFPSKENAWPATPFDWLLARICAKQVQLVFALCSDCCSVQASPQSCIGNRCKHRHGVSSDCQAGNVEARSSDRLIPSALSCPCKECQICFSSVRRALQPILLKNNPCSLEFQVVSPRTDVGEGKGIFFSVNDWLSQKQ